MAYGSSNTSIIKRKIGEGLPSDQYICLYSNAYSSYWISKGLWLKYISLIGDSKTDLNGLDAYQIKQCLSVVPEYGKYVYSLVVYCFKRLSSVTNLTDIFDRLALDGSIFYSLLENTRMDIRSKVINASVIVQTEKIIDEHKKLEEDLKIKEEQLVEAQKHIKNLEKKVSLLEQQVQDYEERLKPVKAEPWVDLPYEPIMKNRKSINSLLSTPESLQEIHIGHKLYFPVDSKISDANLDFLKSNVIDILEFLGRKMPILLTYIRHYKKLQKRGERDE